MAIARRRIAAPGRNSMQHCQVIAGRNRVSAGDCHGAVPRLAPRGLASTRIALNFQRFVAEWREGCSRGER